MKKIVTLSKNFFKKGDKVAMISPDRDTIEFTMGDIYDMDGNIIDASRHPENQVRFRLDKEVKKYDMLRIN